MKHDKKRISKIVDELITYFFSMGATDIDISLKEKKDHYQISLKCNYSCKCKDQGKIDKLVKYLKCEKQEEMEEYFWELTGDCDVDTELTLVGMMTDEAKVSCSDNKIEVNLIRYKS